MTVKFVQVLDGDLADSAWELYTAAFTELNRKAVQRHLMTRAEFDQVMADERVDKVLTLGDAGEMVGLSTFTNHLDAVPLIAPEYFEAHWPVHYAQQRIWYIGFVAVAPAAQGSGAFTEVFIEFHKIAAAVDGIVGLDVCVANEDVARLPRAIEIFLRRLSGGVSRATRIDRQNYWLFEMNAEAS